MKRLIALGLIVFAGAVLSGCAAPANNTQRGTLLGTGIGAGLGAIAGQAIGGDTEATLIGAGIGAALGGVAGNRFGAYMDQQERELQQALAASQAASLKREQDILTATFSSSVLFDFDSAVLKPGGRAELARVSDVLNRYPQTVIRIEGHTDAAGSEQYNQQLSERRAQAVKDALVQLGVAEGRLIAIGFGETQPISSSAAANRRVAIVIQPSAMG